MDDLIKTFKATLYDRVSSPLFSSLLIAWVSWNHRLIFALLSSDEVAKKFEYIDEKLYPTWVQVLGTGLAFPLLSACFLIYVFPHPARWVYEHTRQEQKKLKEIQQRIDDETPITKEEARELKAAIRKADADFEREMDVKNKQILQLREEVRKLEAERDATKDESISDRLKDERKETVELDERATNLLRDISAAPNGIAKERITPAVNERDRLLVQYALDQLLAVEFIRLTQRGVYVSTPKGRAHIVQNGIEKKMSSSA